MPTLKTSRSLFLTGILSAVLTGGCSKQIAQLPADAYDAQVAVIIAAAAATEHTLPDPNNPSPAPDPDRPLKPGDKCPNFLGRLPCASGDGLRRCTKCGGDGRIDKEDLAISDMEGERTVSLHASKAYSGDGKWPLIWYRQEAPKLSPFDIDVRLVAEPDGEPYLELREGFNVEVYKRSLSASEIVKIFDRL